MVKTKTVYQYDKDGYYTGPEIAFESPLEPEVYPLPANCTEVQPPEVSDENVAKWNGSAWEVVEKPVPEDPGEIDPESPTNPYVTYDDLATYFRKGVNSCD